jgi:hypothetical protein
MQHIDLLGRHYTVVPIEDADRHRYDLVDNSPGFQHVIAVILQDLVYKANRLRYFNNEFQAPIRFGVPPNTEQTWIAVFPNKAYFVYSFGKFSVYRNEIYQGEWVIPAAVQPNAHRAAQLCFASNYTGDPFSQFVELVAKTLIGYRYLLKQIEEPHVSIGEINLSLPNNNSIIELIKFENHNYIFSFLFGGFKDLLYENNLIGLITIGTYTLLDAQEIVAIQLAYTEKKIINYITIHYSYSKNCFSLTINKGETESYRSEITIVFDSQRDRLGALLKNGLHILSVNEDDELKMLEFPSQNSVKAECYMDNYKDYNTALHFFRLFTLFINRFRLLFRSTGDLPPNIILSAFNEEIESQLIGIESPPPPPIETTPAQPGVYISNHNDVLSRISKFCSYYNSQVINRLSENRIIICRRNDVVHLSIFKNALKKGKFHFTNECIRNGGRVYFSIKADMSYKLLVNDKAISLQELAEQLLGTRDLYIKSGARRMENVTIETIKESILFYYTFIGEIVAKHKECFEVTGGGAE